MTKSRGSHHDARSRLAVCALGVVLAGLCWLSVPAAQADETPAAGTPEKPAAQPAADDAKPAADAPPKQTEQEGEAPEAAPEAATEEATDEPAQRPRNFLQRLLFGPIFGSDDGEPGMGTKRRPRTDPRAPFNPKLSTLLKKAQTQFKAGEHRQSLETLQRLLEMPEDALWEASPGKLVSVRSAAHKLLAQLPAAELERYRLQSGGAAQRELQQAQADGSMAALAQVATRYFQTEAGFQAANQLATRYLDRGEFGLAAFWLRELLESGAPVTKDPAWRLKAEYVARKIDSSTLKKLLGGPSTATAQNVVIGGQSVNREAWLAKLTSTLPWRTPTLQDWPQFFGSARRVGQAAEGEPLLLPRWTYPMTFSLAIHERLQQLITDLRDQEQVPIFTFDPLLVDGKVVFRSLRGVKVVSAATGQLQWETADEPAVEDVLAAGGSPGSGNNDLNRLGAMFAQAAMLQQELEEVPVSDNPLTHLLFRNSNHGLLSSDGQRLFVIEDLSVMTNLQPGQYWGEDLPDQDPLGRPLGINRLTAYDLQTGRSVWEMGGPSLNDPFELPLAGSFFFGAPVVDGGDLFVVAEKDGVLRLHALDAATGKPRWSQVIANAQARINMDVGRQWLSAPVAVGDGVIVCPTTIGWLVAIDRSTHGILWAYRYQDFHAEDNSEPQDEALQPAELNERWAAAPPVIVDDRVLFTPPEESRMICLSLSDGREIWSQPRNSALFLAGIFNDQVVTVGPNYIAATNLKQGQPRRVLKFRSPDARPAGRGVAVQDRYYLPLTTGELLAVNLKTWKLEESSYLPAADKPELKQFGNLAMYHGMLLSLSPHGLVAFEPKLSIVSELRQQLAEDPQSAPAAVRQAELQLLNHQYTAARVALQPVSEGKLTGDLRRRYRAAMITVLSALVRQDLAAGDAEFEELARLAGQPSELQAVERLRAERLLHRRDYLNVFAVYSRFSQDFGTELISPGDSATWQVRGDQWAAGKTAELFKLAPAEVRPALDQLVVQAATAAAKGTLAEQERLLHLHRGHPAVASIGRQLVEAHAAAGNRQIAENMLLELQLDPAQRVWSLERLARLWQETGLAADAAHFYQVLERDHAAAMWDDVRTVGQFIQDQRSAGQLPAPLDRPLCDWHNRDLDTMRSGSNFDGGGQIKDFNLHGAGLPFFRQHRLQFVVNEPLFEVIDAATEKRLWSLPVRSAYESGATLAQVAVTGHQIVLFEGGAVSGLSPTDRRVLWTHVDDNPGEEDLGGDLEQGQTPAPVRGLGASATLFGLEAALGDDWSTFAAQGSARLANHSYVSYVVRRQLVTLDANTGSILWRRDGLPAGARLLGGPRVLYLWNPAADQVTAYNSADGSELKVPRLATLCKKSIASVQDDFIGLDRGTGIIARKAQTVRLQRFDPVAQVARWSIELPRKVQAATLSGNRLALVDPQGQIQLCDLESGTLRACGSLPRSALRPNTQIYMIPTYDQLLVVAHQEARFQNDRYGETFPSIRVAGTIHAFDLATGKEQWMQRVDGLHLILERLDHSPIVLLLARTFEQNGSNWKLALKAIDRQHGQIVHESENQVQSSFHQMSVNMQEEFVELRTYNDRLRLFPKSK